MATDTWVFEVRPHEFENAFQPLHQVVIPHVGLYIGERRDLDELAADVRPAVTTAQTAESSIL